MDRKKKNMAVCILFAVLLFGGFFLCLFLPKPAYSKSERRGLMAMPEFSAENLWSGRFMTDFESYAADAFPFRDSFRGLKALTAGGIFFRQDNNGIYVWDDYISAVEYPLNEESLDHAVERFRFICDKYLTDENNVFLTVIPDKNTFLAKESGHLSLDYEDFEKRMAEKADFAEYISVSDLLEKEDYYRTDTHWRQERITDVADRLAEAMGTRLSGEYGLHTLTEEFYGVYHGQAALPIAPESLQYMTGDGIDQCSVYDLQNGRDIQVYDLAQADGRDPYEMFLYGSLSLLMIENPKALTDKRLVLFRDSFGSSIAPLLISGYSKITVVDIRYIRPEYLGQFMDFSGCDVLFLYSTLVLNHSETIK